MGTGTGDAPKELDYDRLFTSIYGPDSATIKTGPIKKFIQFLLIQSKTALPGIIHLFLEEFFRLLPQHKNDYKAIWKVLNDEMIRNVLGRKKSMAKRTSLLASMHILTLRCKSLRKDSPKNKNFRRF